MRRRNVRGLTQQIILGLFVFLFPATVAYGATYYVRTDGNNANNGLANTAANAWRTIDWAADHVAAGDVVRVQAGHYAEAASLGVSGTSGNTVTLIADGTVTTCGMTFSGKRYIRVIGFTMDPDKMGCTANSTMVYTTGTNTGLEFWNNTFQNTNANAFTVSDLADRCNACIFLGNTFQNIGRSTTGYTALAVIGNDTFIGYGTFRTICYLGVVQAGNRQRAVNLNFSGMVQCGGTHPDFYYPHGLSTLGYNDSLVEATYGIGTPTANHNKFMNVQPQVMGVAFSDDIWRFNVDYNLGSGFYSMGDGTAALNRMRFYNNSHVNCQRANNFLDSNSCGTLSGQGGNGMTASIYNTIFYQAWADMATTYVTPWDENLGSPVITKGYNLAYSPLGSVTFQSQWMGQAQGQSNVNPSFVNAASDFTLQSGSAARGAGGPLTTTNGSRSSSTSLTVAPDTGSLFIGSNASNLPQYGGALAPGDVITVGSTTVQVASRSGDTLTLASAISWNNGDPVYFGSSPIVDIGAYPYKASGYALSAEYSCSAGTCTIQPSDASLVRFVVCYDDGVPYAVDNASPYRCAAATGTFSARAYPRYASKTLWTTATSGTATSLPSAPRNLRIVQ